MTAAVRTPEQSQNAIQRSPTPLKSWGEGFPQNLSAPGSPNTIRDNVSRRSSPAGSGILISERLSNLPKSFTTHSRLFGYDLIGIQTRKLPFRNTRKVVDFFRSQSPGDTQQEHENLKKAADETACSSLGDTTTR